MKIVVTAEEAEALRHTLYKYSEFYTLTLNQKGIDEDPEAERDALGDLLDLFDAAIPEVPETTGRIMILVIPLPPEVKDGNV